MIWQIRAACRGADPELFFPGPGKSTAEAKAICAACSVQAECLAEHLWEPDGVWGGMSDPERQRLRTRRLVSAGPTVEDLLAIDEEWPVLAAELAVVDAECRFLAHPDALARRHLRRASASLARTVIAHLNRNPIGATQ